MEITTVKYIAEIDNPTVPTGYSVNGNISVPLNSSNRHTRLVEEWIGLGKTPEPAFTQDEIDEYNLQTQEAAIKSAIDAIVVPYTIDMIEYTFSGHLEAQNRIAVALQKTKGNPNKQQSWFTIDSQKIKVTSADLEAILALIDVEMEAILDAV